MYRAGAIEWGHIKDRMAVFKTIRKESGQRERDAGGKRDQPSRTGSLGPWGKGGRGRGSVT